ncbi:MAG: hypothetical protein ACUZ8O_10950 [Candidatus Anammoxibacter sp.]
MNIHSAGCPIKPGMTKEEAIEKMRETREKDRRRGVERSVRPATRGIQL